MPQERVNLRLGQLLATMVVFFVLLVYFVGMMGNRDPLWFWPFFDEKPDRIVIHQGGKQTVLALSNPGYAELTQAINESLPRIDGYQDRMGLSETMLGLYRTKYSMVEIFYPQPITIHSLYSFGHPDSLLIPLSGPFADTPVVFGGKGGEYWAGALRLKSTAAIKDTVEKLVGPLP
jgi:hypothetical protein